MNEAKDLLPRTQILPKVSTTHFSTDSTPRRPEPGRSGRLGAPGPLQGRGGPAAGGLRDQQEPLGPGGRLPGAGGSDGARALQELKADHAAAGERLGRCL